MRHIPEEDLTIKFPFDHRLQRMPTAVVYKSQTTLRIIAINLIFFII
jgi:hypothetical protein